MPIIIISGMAYSILAKKLTIMAASTGGILALVIFIAAGYLGLLMMTTFFILGSASTSWQRHKKQAFAVREEAKKGRNAIQVLANAGAPAMAGIIIIIYPQFDYLMLPAMAAAFASATADTLSSELGMVYGRRFFNIITFRSDRCGMDGVISLEGTVIGIAGSCVIAGLYVLGQGWNIIFYFIVLAGTLGNLTDSVLGAVLERKGIIGNDVVNFLNTLTAAAVMVVLEVYFL
ncbi:DUF92 domain-containing protein [Pedobacter miscanthi]|uniref:DUF92 domain-containing protein n=1 Tax=Pedobacter miscanthi TaxID=2259170 RepID=UPI00292D5873|nr:DUF92 domain-containing protein [Pedobacter miscanthi]